MPIIPQKLIWKDEYSVKVKLFDEQHQRLIGIMNDLIDCLNSIGSSDVKIDSLMSLLRKNELEHFATEEQYFQKFHYPEAAAHILKHRNFIEQCDLLEKSNADNVNDRISNIVYFLEDWWISHICGDDKKYSDFFNDHGLQ